MSISGGDSNIKHVGGVELTLGQKQMVQAIPVVIASDQSAIPISGAGSGGTSSNFAAAFPAAGTAVGAKDTLGNMASLNLDGSGNLKVAGGAGGSGTEYADGAVRGTATGTLAMGDDGTNIQSVKVDANGVLAIQDNGGTITVDGPVTDAQLRAAPVAVADGGGSLTIDGSVTVSNFTDNGLTDTQLRATPVPVSGTVAVTQPVAVTDNGGSLTIDGAPTVAKATVAAPTYVEGTDVALSTDLAGNLRISGTISASSSAKATASEPVYVENTDNAFSQDLSGHLRTKVHVLVSETPEGYIDGDIKPLSMTNAGRLRVSMVPADVYMELFHGGNFITTLMDMTDTTSPWAINNSPWSGM